MGLSFNAKGEVQEKIVSDNVRLIKKLAFYDAISLLTLYLKGLRREIAKTTLEITSSTPLSLAEKNIITKIACKNFKINKILTTVDPSLLGGLCIKIGDTVFDDSVKNKIGQVKGFING